MKIAFARLFAVLSLVSVLGLAQRPGDFRIVGPGGGGAMFHPTVSPHDVNTVLVSCDMTGAYITHDAGRSWRMFSLRGTVNFFVFDPVSPHTIYAQTNVLWRSTDDGETWKLIYPRPSTVEGVRLGSDHADEIVLASSNPLGSTPMGLIDALAIDPSDSRTLYAAAGSKSAPELFISHDYGENWKREASLPETALRIWIDPKSPRDSRALLIAGPHQIMSVTGSSVNSVPAPATVTFTDVSVGFNTAGKPTIYATSEEGGFVSSDSGHTWQAIMLPGAQAKVRAIATSLLHPRTAYISYSNLVLDGDSWQGVAKTMDAGHTWQFVWKEGVKESSPGASNVHDAWITGRFGPEWAENPLCLGVADQDPNLTYATDLGRTMRTTDGGKNWTAVYSRRVQGAGWVSTGLDVTTSYGVHFDPFDAKRQFITTTDIGLFRSEDGGKSWMSSTRGVPRQWLNTTYWIEFDPKVRNRMWSVNSYTHDLPRPKMWRHTSVESYKGGVCRSDDGGRTWVKSNMGMEETAPTHILLDPTSPVGARVLYVAAFGRGVYKSTDDGHSWHLKNNGITQADPLAWRLARAKGGTLYLVMARRSEDGSIGNPGDGALYKSVDGAETWEPIALPAEVNGPNGIAIDPVNPQRLYLAAWSRAKGVHGVGGGIYLSEDGGKSWRQVLDRDQHVYDVVIDPRNHDILYAAGFESSAWRSSDRGLHWRRISGYNFKWGHRVVPDPATPNDIYVTTFGGGVWHGSTNGESKPLDILTPQMEPQ